MSKKYHVLGGIVLVIDSAEDAFLLFKRELELSPEKFLKARARVCWEVKGDIARHWVTELSSYPKVTEGFDAGSDCIVYMSENDLVDIVNKRRNIQDAFLDGRVRLSGSSKAALWITLLIEHVTLLR